MTLCPFSFIVAFSIQWNAFLDGIQSPLVSSKLLPCLEEAWPVILLSVAMDAVPLKLDGNGSCGSASLISGYSMVELGCEDYQFLWGFALLVLFQGQHQGPGKQTIPLGSTKENFDGDSTLKETNSLGLKLHEIVLPVFQFLSTRSFFSAGFLTLNICQELLQVLTYFSPSL